MNSQEMWKKHKWVLWGLLAMLGLLFLIRCIRGLPLLETKDVLLISYFSLFILVGVCFPLNMTFYNILSLTLLVALFFYLYEPITVYTIQIGKQPEPHVRFIGRQ